jgi:transposase
MLNLSNRRIFIAQKAIDMRRGIDTLSSMVSSELGHDPYAGDVFIFIGRDRRRVKILTWDISGFWLALKRLERGTFARPPTPAVDLVGRTVQQLSSAELQLVLEGVVVHHATYHSHYRRASETVMNNSS